MHILLKNILEGLHTAHGNKKGTNEHFFKKAFLSAFTSAKK